MTSATASQANLLLSSTAPFLFFTGKGGVGKTTLACATAIHLADAGQRVLLVSTDPASNLDEMLDTPLSDSPRSVKGIPRLWALNIEPGQAAEDYRSRVLGQMAQPAMLPDQGHKVVRKLLLVLPPPRDLALCRPVLAERRTGPTLGDRQSLPDVRDARPAPRGAQ